VAACAGLRQSPAEPANASVPAVAASAPAAAAGDYTLVLIKTGPKSGQLPAEETKTLFAGHFANMRRMAEEGQLLLAGPFGETRHDPALRGIFVLDTGDLERARQIAGTDPPTQAGIFTLDFHALSTDAPLRAMHARVMELDAQAEAKAQAEGRERKPGEGGRSFVLLTADDGERAGRVLQPLQGSGLVLLVGRLDGTAAFAVLDATDQDQARAALAAHELQLGPYVLDDWFASSELTAMPSLSRQK
jgi:uncharacterized protein YciI